MKAKTIPTADLECALAQCQGIEAAIARDKRLWREAMDELPALARSADFSDESAVQRLSRLRTIVSFAPDRLQARVREYEAAQKTLVDLCQGFVSKVFAPRLADMEARALVKVKTQIKGAFPNEDALQTAAYQSTELLQLAPIKARAGMQTYHLEDQMRQAQRLLEAWRAADAFEQEHLT